MRRKPGIRAAVETSRDAMDDFSLDYGLKGVAAWANFTHPHRTVVTRLKGDDIQELEDLRRQNKRLGRQLDEQTENLREALVAVAAAKKVQPIKIEYVEVKMATFNRSAQRAAATSTGKGFGGGGSGDFWNLSKAPAGRFVFRILPAHPTKNPEILVYRPLHFLGEGKQCEIYACNRYAPTEIIQAAPAGFPIEPILDEAGNVVGQRPSCAFCECVEYYAEMNDRNPYEFEGAVPNPQLRDIIANLRPKGNTHCAALLLAENAVQHNPPKPIHFIVSAEGVTKVLDDEGIGRSPEAGMELTDVVKGRNFTVEKKSAGRSTKYGVCSWDVFGTPLIPTVTVQQLQELLGPKYPDIASCDKDRYKPYGDGVKVLEAMGL